MGWDTTQRIAVCLVALITLGRPIATSAQQKTVIELIRYCMQQDGLLTVRGAGRGDSLKDFCAGTFYQSGRDGVAKNLSAAMRYYRLSGDAGFAAGQMGVGNLYLTQGDYAQAMSWFQRAASQNFGDAQWEIGKLYLSGTGVAKSRNEAMKWFRLAAANGSADGKSYIARIDAGVDTDRQEPAQDLYVEGQRIWKSGNQAGAARPFLAAAQAGHSLAQLQIGWHYENGIGVHQSYTDAALWYRKAADQGVMDAMTNLALLYELGRGVPEDWLQSAKWRKRSAEFGSSGGESALGDAYQFGIGVPQNRKLAISWHRQAALQGDSHSAYCEKWLSDSSNFVGFLNVAERNLFPAMPTSPIPAEPQGTIFHNSTERIRYMNSVANSMSSGSGTGYDWVSSWDKAQKNLYEQHKHDTDWRGNSRPCVRTSTGETQCP